MRLARLTASALVTLAFFLCLLAVPLGAQTAGTGALSVTVIDPTGAVIPGATVTVVSTATGMSRAQASGDNGSAQFTMLSPGGYRVSIFAEGFKIVEIPSVIVNVSETHVLNQRLELGATQEQVTVQEQTEAMQAEGSTLGGVVGTRQLNSLPLVTRNYTQIIGLSPGAVMDVNNASAVGRGSQYVYVNGSTNVNNNFLMDGVTVTNYANAGSHDYIGFYGSIPIPSPDALQEFKVQTSLYDASYGRNTGANVNVVTKSGSNDLHGSLFEFLRNDLFNANDFFRNRSGNPRAKLKQNQFGGTLGTPLVKDKLFLFLSYQGTRQVNGVATQGQSSANLPPQLGNDRSAAALGSAFCPQNNPTGSPGVKYATTFAGGAQVACDGSNINPVALSILNAKWANGAYMIPAPQSILNAGSAAAVGFSTFTNPAVFKEDQALANLDYMISPNHTLAARYFYAYSPQTNGFGSCSPGCLPGSGATIQSGNQILVLKLTSVLTPKLINEARASYYYIRASDNTLDPLTSTGVGMTPPAPFYPVLPVLSFVTPAFSFGGSAVDGAREPQYNYEFSEQIAWSHGAHTIKAGVSAQRVIWNGTYYGNNRGSLTFMNFADFLVGQSAAQNHSPLGYSNIYSTSLSLTIPGGVQNLLRTNFGSAFVQDDFKVSRRLTLNFGVRWEYDGLLYDVRESDGGFVMKWGLLNQVPLPPAGGTYAGYTVANNYNGSVPDGVVRRSTNALNDQGSPLHDFAPRFGFVWQPLSTERFVVRGGYGWFWNAIGGNGQALALSGGPPIAHSNAYSGASNGLASLQQPANPLPDISFAGFLRTPSSLINGYGTEPTLTIPLTHSYNLNLQYSITPSIVLEVGYVGTRAEHVQTAQSLNVPLLASPNNPVNCGLATGCLTTNTPQNALQRVPVIGITPGGVLDIGNFGDSSYNSIQAVLRKSFSHGLQFQAAYTFGRAFSDITGTILSTGTNGSVNSNNPNDRAQQRAVADFNRPQRLVLNYTYSLPSYNRGDGFTGQLLSGWSVSGLTTAQSGLPMTVTDSRGAAGYGSVGTSRAQICPGATYDDLVRPGNIESLLNGYFNSSATCAIPIVPNGSSTATGYGNMGRNILFGPGQFNWDAAVAKKTKVGGLNEDAYLEFRAEFFNTFNHPQFSNPNANAASASFGVIGSTSVAPRILQFAMRYSF
ncbi:MAG TPA: carboxypeptidase-like regulatory domain-containing protein [Bryobacteraceae bacterium]|nr:carboxypeptidase-like regulatory domain-containing protein [Bryobacteraceae bacterium]